MNLPTGNAYLDRTEQKIQRLTARMLSTVGTERFRLQKQIRKLKERRVSSQLARARVGPPREDPPRRSFPHPCPVRIIGGKAIRERLYILPAGSP